jgi:hypothetical protein
MRSRTTGPQAFAADYPRRRPPSDLVRKRIAEHALLWEGDDSLPRAIRLLESCSDRRTTRGRLSRKPPSALRPSPRARRLQRRSSTGTGSTRSQQYIFRRRSAVRTEAYKPHPFYDWVPGGASDPRSRRDADRASGGAWGRWSSRPLSKSLPDDAGPPSSDGPVGRIPMAVSSRRNALIQWRPSSPQRRRCREAARVHVVLRRTRR